EIHPVDLHAERAREDLGRHRLAGTARAREEGGDASAHRAQPRDAPALVDRPAPSRLHLELVDVTSHGRREYEVGPDVRTWKRTREGDRVEGRTVPARVGHRA